MTGKKRGGGGSTAQKGKRNIVQHNDVYFNFPVARYVIDYLSPHLPIRKELKILDACSNDGVLGITIMNWYNSRNLNAKLTMQDIKMGGGSITDFYPSGKKYDVIICNPPWVPVELAEEIYHHLYKNCLAEDGVMFYVINSTFCYQGIDRAKKLKFQKYYFLPRYTFKSVGRPLLDCGVMVTHKDDNINKKATQLDCFVPIDREICKMEFKPMKEWK